MYAILDVSERTILLQSSSRQLGLLSDPENTHRDPNSLAGTVKNDSQVNSGAKVTFSIEDVIRKLLQIKTVREEPFNMLQQKVSNAVLSHLGGSEYCIRLLNKL